MNYYEILKVSKNSSSKEIRESYIELIKKYHPDVYIGDKSFAEKTTKTINDAYDTLSDPEKRAEYDLSLSENSSEYNYQSNSTQYYKPYDSDKIKNETISNLDNKTKLFIITLLIFIGLIFITTFILHYIQTINFLIHLNN